MENAIQYLVVFSAITALLSVSFVAVTSGIMMILERRDKKVEELYEDLDELLGDEP